MDYERIKNDYIRLQEMTQRNMLRAYSVITRGDRLLFIRMRHAVIILIQQLLQWRTLLNRVRVTLDERMEIPFPPSICKLGKP